MRRRDLLLLLGGASMSPPALHAQQKATPVIGYLGTLSPGERAPYVAAFRQGLYETGYVEGQNVTIEYRWARGQYDRLPELAADLVQRQVSVIAAMAGPPPALAAKAATSTIPIVFYLGVDPIQFGLVASLNRPGGNMTGLAFLNAELAGKRLELLHELLPAASAVVLLVNPTNPSATEEETRNFDDAAHALGLPAHTLRASTPSEIEAAFATLVELPAVGLIVSSDPFFTSRKDQIVSLATHRAVPATYVWREFAEAGGLMSYGGDLADGYRKAGIYAGKILKGAKPADLPVEQTVKIELVINLNTAKALGLTIPPTLLARADDVIE
jgi:putative tryptophan/tyrosine transport system substrate-binding protein